MKKNSEVFKLLVAVSLTAVSVAIDAIFKYLIPIETFGLPFYAIPLVIGSIVLGPFYGAMMAIVGDAVGVLISGYSYLPLYVIAAISWGVVPSLIVRNKYHIWKLIIGVFVAYLIASLSNTFANYFYWGTETAIATLFIRIALIVPNAFVITALTHVLYKRLNVIYPQISAIENVNDTQ